MPTRTPRPAATDSAVAPQGALPTSASARPVAYTTTLGARFESLVFIGAGLIDGTGNAADTEITGNDVANRLTGLDGQDILSGGATARARCGAAGARIRSTATVLADTR